jgi:L,D-transpeptidase YcbB
VRAMNALPLVFAIVVAAVPAVAGVSASPTVIGDLLRAADPVMLDGEPLEGPRLRGLYESRAYQPLWIVGSDRSRVDQVLAGLSDVAADGLEVAHYHPTQIAARRAAGDERAASELDVFISNALLRYATDVRVGRRQPQVTTGEVDIPPRTFDAVAAVGDLAIAPDVRSAFEQLATRNPEYRRLRELLARYRKAVDAGNWVSVPADGVSPGASGPAVLALRRRLQASGELSATAVGDTFDAEAQDALRRFQKSVGLAEDGALNKATREALNVPVATRIGQVRANMERWRWFPEDLGARHVRVNVASFRLQLLDQGGVVTDMPVIVGKNDWRTPIITSQIQQLVFNPPWNVPPNIIRKEMIGRARSNPAYFNRIGLKVHRRGGPVKASAVNWATAGIGSFSLQQPPGPGNPLGRVKFHFPNGSGVYLHDTNRKGGFSAGFRAMSHGCIRVGDAIGLANEILNRDVGEPGGGRVRTLTRDWSTKWVNLTTPVPVHVAYETVTVAPDGVVTFARDFYGRDARLLEDLRKKNGPVFAPRVATPPVAVDPAIELPPAVAPQAVPGGAPQETSVPTVPAT